MKDYLNEISALLVGAVLLILALYNRAWWGDSAAGAMIGAGVVILAILLIVIFERRGQVPFDAQTLAPWLLLVVGAATALLLRSPSGRGPASPVQIQVPSAGQLQALFLILVILLLFTLIGVFVRAVGRGEGVSVESHWGGLGGGLGGFQVSPPLIYLLGIMLLLTISSAIAWRAYGQPQAQQPAAAAQASASPSPAASPEPSQSSQ